MNRTILFLIFLLFIIASCRERNKTNTTIMIERPVYFDYQVWGDDEKNDVTVLLQFRPGSSESRPVALQPPSKIELDEKVLKADSSRMSGAYYEAVSTVDSFAGNHTIIFTDKAGKKYKEEFNFRPFSLQSELADTIHRSDFALQFKGLNGEDYLHIIAIDTSFRSRGLNELDTIKNGRLTFSKQQLKSLVNGPVTMEFYKEEEIPVKNGTAAGGYLLITYGVKEQFYLAD